MLGGFHKIFIYISYKNSLNFLLNMFHLEPTPLSLNKMYLNDENQIKNEGMLNGLTYLYYFFYFYFIKKSTIEMRREAGQKN